MGDVRRFVALLLVLVVAAGCGSQQGAANTPAESSDLSPLSVAVWRGDLARVKSLLAAGADPALPGTTTEGALDHMTPWMWALVARDEAAQKLLLGGPRMIAANDPSTIVSFRMAVAQGNAWMVRELIRRRVPVDSPSEGRATPLIIAASNGNAPMLALLLDSGANVNLADGSGDTALMAAVRVGSSTSVELLLARGADVANKDNVGRTALDWARRGRLPEIEVRLVAARATAGVPARTPVVPTLAEAVARSIPVLQRGAGEWLERTSCSSCHHQAMILQVTELAERSGITYDRGLARVQRDHLAAEEVQFEQQSRDALASDDKVLHASMRFSGDDAFSVGTIFSARIADGLTRGGPEEPSAALLARTQLADGHWRYGPLRGASESSDIAATANAIRVLPRLTPASMADEVARRLEQARRWLLAAIPATTVDHTYRLLGLRWLDAEPRVIAEQTERLRRLQRPDGSWSHVDGHAGDAFTTGLVLVALREAGGVAVSDPLYRRGIDYLLGTQEPDGTWLVHSRAAPLLEYTDGGFPHGKFQFISFAGTSWATMALIHALSAERSR